MADQPSPLPRRFNDWKHWQPLLVSVDDDLFRAVDKRCAEISGHEIAAVYRYTALTGFTGIEFVVVASFIDAVPFRQIGEALWLVPCRNVLEALIPEQQSPQIGDFLYDGWLRLPDGSDTSITDGLRRIDEVVAMLGHVHRCPCRRVVKYAETLDHGRNAVRTISEKDHGELTLEVGKLERLPAETRAAVVRSATWVEISRNRAGQSDRFLALWLAMESLFLTLYDNADELELPVDDAYSRLSKSHRRIRRQGDIAAILKSNLELDDAVREAYFHCITPLRRRVEVVVRALFGENESVTNWLYSGQAGKPAPAQVRAEMVHQGLSGVDASARASLDRLSGELEGIVEEALNRVIDRKWGGSEPARPNKRYSISFAFDDFGGNVKGPMRFVSRGSEITPNLLMRKGLL